MIFLLCRISTHVVANSLVIQHSFNATKRADGNVLIPQSPLGKVQHILLGDLINDALNVLRRHAASSGDDLAANVLGDSGGAIKRKKD